MSKTKHTPTVRPRPLRLGFVPLCDCAPIVMARELGLFEKHGVKVELSREVGWATIRDKIVYGEIEAAHAPAGMVVAASAGLGSIPVPCLTGLVINTHGNAITLSQQLWKKGVRNGADFKREILKERDRHMFTLGTVFPYSSHTFLLRLWLRSNGIDPVRDVRIVVVPPPQMFPNLKGGNLDGYCVGEPWNSAAVMAGTGFIAATSAELAPFHPEKTLLVKREFSEARHGEHLALIAALVEACAYCDASENGEEIIRTLALPEYLGAAQPVISASMGKTFDLGNNRTMPGRDFHIFSRDNTNEPGLDKAMWVMRSLREDPSARDSQTLASLRPGDLFRPDLYHEALNTNTNHHEKPDQHNRLEVDTQEVSLNHR